MPAWILLRGKDRRSHFGQRNRQPGFGEQPLVEIAVVWVGLGGGDGRIERGCVAKPQSRIAAVLTMTS